MRNEKELGTDEILLALHPSTSNSKEKIFLFLSTFILFSFCLFLYIVTPETKVKNISPFLEILFFWALLLSLFFNHYFTGTGIIIYNLFFTIIFGICSLSCFKFNDFLLCLLMIYLIQIIDWIRRSFESNESQIKILHIEKLKEKVAEINEEIKHSKILHDNLENQIKLFSKLREFIARPQKIMSIESITDYILNFLSKSLPNAHIYTLSLFDDVANLKNSRFMLKGSLDNNVVNPNQVDQFIEWMIRYRSPLLIKNTSQDYRFQINHDENFMFPGTKSIIASPLLADNKPLGIIRLDSNKSNQFEVGEFRFLVIFSSICALMLKNAELLEETKRLSITDGLTNMFLPRYFSQYFQNFINKTPKATISLIMIDIDFFKNINDHFGHVMGDQVLIRLSQVIKSIVKKRNNGICIRYGGEEIAILLPHIKKKLAISLAEELRTTVMRSSFAIGRESINLTLSLGVGSYPLEANNQNDLLKISDARLYQAKKNGRNQTVSI